MRVQAGNAPKLSKRIRDVAFLAPIELEIVDQLVARAVGLLRPRHGVIAAGDQRPRNLHTQKTVMIVAVALTISALYFFVIRKPKQQNGRLSVSVRLKWLHQAQFAGFYVAISAAVYVFLKYAKLWELELEEKKKIERKRS